MKSPFEPKYQFIPVTTVEALDTMLNELMAEAYDVGHDTETSGLDTLVLDLYGMSFCWKRGFSYYCPANIIFQRLPRIQEMFNSKLIVWANAKFEWQVCKRVGLVPPPRMMDVIALDYLRDPDLPHGLKDQAKRYLDWDMTEFDSFEIPFNTVPIQQATDYAAADSAATREVFHKHIPELVGMEDLVACDHGATLALAPVELRGMQMDPKILEAYRKPLVQKISQLKREMLDLAGIEFEVDSSAQVSKLLFEHLNLPGIKKTKGGRFTTDAMTLEQLRGKHEIVGKIIDYREFTKLKTNMVEGLLKGCSKVDGALHASYMMTVVPTGRLACSTGQIGGGGYNIQQIAKEGKVVEVECRLTDEEVAYYRSIGGTVEELNAESGGISLAPTQVDEEGDNE